MGFEMFSWVFFEVFSWPLDSSDGFLGVSGGFLGLLLFLLGAPDGFVVS